ncbi:hypothetical protein [Foetidibacter luteolus]|uniref:hypothetical protein n=1 Tax=Foetidibacter luteolus TaxID=2608880 RepID=UPI00129BD92B|nr:hypothetical protein [Foetidibacter luteolus]
MIFSFRTAITAAAILLHCTYLCAQGMGIGTTTPAPSAQLDITSTTRGLLMPRMTTDQRVAIASPAAGLQVYDITTRSFWYYNGTAWVQPSGGSSGLWVADGANIYNSNGGNVGIGTLTPFAKLHIAGNSRIDGTWFAKGAGLHTGYDDHGNFRYWGSGFSTGYVATDWRLESNNEMLLTGNKMQAYNRADADGVDDEAIPLLLNPLGGNVGIGTDYLPGYARLEISIANGERGWAVGNGKYNMHSFLGGAGRSPNSEGCYLGTGGQSVPLHFFTNSQWAQVTLLPNGNVGINTTEPSGKLDIKGSINYSHFYYGADENTYIRGGKANSTVIINDDGGNVGIGTPNPTHKLTVNGTIRAKELRVNTGWADYVFEDDYPLMPLAEVERYINRHKHLPGIPEAGLLQKEGVDVSEMQTKMMAKIEELTLYLIATEKKLAVLQKENTEIKRLLQRALGNTINNGF